ncbi:hypothetical protein, partial [Nocardia wallacei]|uniref:hypothetical protein n=1 Tax=Nocardia wallacei TaxID=480035 RepID=UPI002453B914
GLEEQDGGGEAQRCRTEETPVHTYIASGRREIACLPPVLGSTKLNFIAVPWVWLNHSSEPEAFFISLDR